MAERKSGGSSAARTIDDETPSKEELQRQMEEARESITETVTEIRERVSNQYDVAVDKIEAVKDTVTEVLDWREKFKENPIVWGAGTLSVGILIGIGLARGLGDARSHGGGRRRSSKLDELGGMLLERLSGVGDAVLPVISGQVKEMFGIDLSDYIHAPPEKKRIAAKKGPAKKKVAAPRKSSGKKRGKRRGGPPAGSNS